ncbi:hypothetical protein [Rhodosalinus sp. 5P4]|uniref:hypothetical protein n=1 Tax=Rhodosalinus sp. 5P4 TaxID=3239196 RepID=UPI0035261CAD
MRVPKFPLQSAEYIWVKTRPAGAIFIFVKDSIDRLSPSGRELLRGKALMIAHDPIDRPITETPFSHVDLHIASSLAQKNALDNYLLASDARGARCGLLLHQPDNRLPENPSTPTDRLRPAYFGDPKNAHLPELIAERVQVVDVGLYPAMTERLSLFGQANFHYAIRPQAQTANTQVFKPLTKAVTAARCCVPVLVNRAAHDAEALLGSDYPYLVDKIDSDSVRSALEAAQMAFGGKQWQRALDRMRYLASLISPKRTARDLEQLLDIIE